MSTWLVQRVNPGWGWDDAPRVIVENAVDNTVKLQRAGIRQENRVYAPLVREGEQYQTEPGDRIRIESKVVRQDGSVDTIVREAIDTGRSVPQYVESMRSESYGITDEERAAGDAQRAQYNQQIFEQNLAANYSAPYEQTYSESAPDAAYSPYDAGYTENAPIGTPVGVYTPPAYYEPDEPQLQWNPNQAAGSIIAGIIQIGQEVTDWLPEPDPAADYLAYLNAQEQAESEGAYGWNGPID